jgi:hypothetical protein
MINPPSIPAFFRLFFPFHILLLPLHHLIVLLLNPYMYCIVLCPCCIISFSDLNKILIFRLQYFLCRKNFASIQNVPIPFPEIGEEK